MIAEWQIFVAVLSDHGGIIGAVELSEPSGWWEPVSPETAARAMIDGVWVRLAGSDEEDPARFDDRLFK